jgi:hypothetical protein
MSQEQLNELQRRMDVMRCTLSIMDSTNGSAIEQLQAMVVRLTERVIYLEQELSMCRPMAPVDPRMYASIDSQLSRVSIVEVDARSISMPRVKASDKEGERKEGSVS